MRSIPALVLVPLVALAGCSSAEDDDPTAQPPAATPTPTPSPTPSPTPTPTPSPTPELSETPTPEPTPEPSTEPTPEPSTAPTKAPGSGRAVRSARLDVSSIAPQLESYYTDREYPVDLSQVLSTLDGAGVRLSPGNTIGGYTLADDGLEFVLCVENEGGAWATYDTSPMTIQESGRAGGCR